jgi:hypothetical protein
MPSGLTSPIACCSCASSRSSRRLKNKIASHEQHGEGADIPTTKGCNEAKSQQTTVPSLHSTRPLKSASRCASLTGANITQYLAMSAPITTDSHSSASASGSPHIKWTMPATTEARSVLPDRAVLPSPNAKLSLIDIRRVYRYGPVRRFSGKRQRNRPKQDGYLCLPP